MKSRSLHTPVHMHKHMYTHVHACIHTHTHVRTHTQYTHAHTHTHTHTHTLLYDIMVHLLNISSLPCLQPGKTDYSFGVDVAALAGLPPSVVARARALLEEGKNSPRQQPHTAVAEEAPQSSHTTAARLTTCECVFIHTLPTTTVHC